jgi:Holliday junction DNA helicase RuvB
MAREPIIQGGGPPPRKQKRGRSEIPPPTTVTGGGFDPNDPRYDDELRPQRLDDVVGQRKVIERLRIILDATRRRNEPLGHVLFDGPPGIGKTTLATVLPRELGVDVQLTSGPSLSAPKDLLPYLTNATYGSVLFIDEIHRLPPAVEEFLYPAMEDFRIDITLGDGLSARTLNLDLKRFTLIGATTRTGMLTAPLRDRFVCQEHLDFYDDDDVREIVQRNARKLRTTITAEAAHEIARRSRGTPRKANNLLRWARDFATVHDSSGDVTTQMAQKALEMLEVDALGLEERDRRYLAVLIRVFAGAPAGLQAIAHSMNVSPDTLEDEVEPFLLRCGFIKRTSRGRMATHAAYAHLSMQPPQPGDDQRRLF